jgi:adenine-specific DNA-methyltransferase
MNQIIFGENYKVLNKLLSEYENKIKLIYIDPPYNTNTDKSYNDKFGEGDGWSKFIYDRLVLSKQLLKKNGVIFISIDDNMYAELKLVCDKIFSKKNYLGTFITMQSVRSNSKHVNTVHEYVLSYAKSKKDLEEFSIPRIFTKDGKAIIDSVYKVVNESIESKDDIKLTEKKLRTRIKQLVLEYNTTWIVNYSNVSKDGRIFFAKDLSTPSQPNGLSIPEIGLNLAKLPTRGWSSKSKFIELYKSNRLVFKADRPYEIHYLEESFDNVVSILNFYSRQGTNDLVKLGLRDIFDTPKPVELIKFLIRISNAHNDTILDYFAGSGTTGQAVLETNLEYKLNNEFILVQLNEKVNPKSKQFEVLNNLKLKPEMKSILLKRIDSFINAHEIQASYKIIEME